MAEEPAPPGGTDLGDQALSDIFREFQKGVDKQLGKEDYETRYNLGIAYKEMGLVDEAIAEFQVAAKDEGRLLDSVDPAFDTPQKLWDALRGQPALTITHHTAGGPIAANWSIPPDPALEPVTEVASVHGSSEAPDSPRDHSCTFKASGDDDSFVPTIP